MNYYYKYKKYKAKYILLKNIKGGDNLDKAINLIKENYKFIWQEMFKNKKEVSGIITNEMKFEYKGPGTEIMVEPEKDNCFANWHSHPPFNVLIKPDDDIYFTPPSLGDIYFSILGSILDKYNYSFVVSREGIYIIEPQPEAKEIAKTELKDLLILDDPWLMPASPITADGIGEIGYNFYGRDLEYPYFFTLLNTKISWDFDNLDGAVKNYIDTFSKFHIKIQFIKHD